MTQTPQADEFWTTVLLQLRQPMTAVSGQVQRAQHLLKTDPKKASEAMNEVVAQIERIDQLLDELHERVRQEE
jgi:signal transduction histidine kinase